MGCFAACARRPTLRALDRRSLFEKSDVKTFKMLRSYSGDHPDKSKFEIQSKNGSQSRFDLLMIFRAFYDIEASVYTLKENHSHKLVGKG